MTDAIQDLNPSRGPRGTRPRRAHGGNPVSLGEADLRKCERRTGTFRSEEMSPAFGILYSFRSRVRKHVDYYLEEH